MYEFYRVSMNADRKSGNIIEMDYGVKTFNGSYEEGLEKLKELGLEGWQIVGHSEANHWETYTLQRRIGNPVEKAPSLEV